MSKPAGRTVKTLLSTYLTSFSKLSAVICIHQERWTKEKLKATGGSRISIQSKSTHHMTVMRYQIAKYSKHIISKGA